MMKKFIILFLVLFTFVSVLSQTQSNLNPKVITLTTTKGVYVGTILYVDTITNKSHNLFLGDTVIMSEPIFYMTNASGKRPNFTVDNGGFNTNIRFRNKTQIIVADENGTTFTNAILSTGSQWAGNRILADQLGDGSVTPNGTMVLRGNNIWTPDTGGGGGGGGTGVMTRIQILDTLKNAVADTLRNAIWVVPAGISSPDTTKVGSEHFGQGSIALAHSTVLGNGANASASYSIAIGENSNIVNGAASSYDILIGAGAAMLSATSSHVGALSTISGDDDASIGQGMFISGKQFAGAGVNGTATRDFISAVGYAFSVSGKNSFSIGAHNIVTADSAGAIGHDLTVNTKFQFKVGGVKDTLVASNTRFDDLVFMQIILPAGNGGASDTFNVNYTGTKSTSVGTATYADPSNIGPSLPPDWVGHADYYTIRPKVNRVLSYIMNIIFHK